MPLPCHVRRNNLSLLPAAAGGEGGVSTPPTAAAAATPSPAPPLQAGRQVEHTGARLQPGSAEILAEDFKGKF